MSGKYQPVLWNSQKKRYDLILAGGVIGYLAIFIGVTSLTNPQATAETLIIRGTGSLAFIMLHCILVIGPLARLNTAFLPLLYNRRHFGVTMFLLGLIHGGISIFQFHALGDINPFVSVLIANTRVDALSAFPFQPLGLLALIILFLMAATSHDFWLKNLSPRIWKTLHMAVYLAYGLLIGHVLLGILQYENTPLRYALLGAGLITVAGLHIAAGWKESRKTGIRITKDQDLIRVCATDEIPENRARIIRVEGDEIAVFKYEGKVSAVHNLCKHQQGPLGEGKIVDGCITCPWHGYQYLPRNGQSPPPFTEKVRTYKVEVRGDDIYIDPESLPEGTAVEPAVIHPQNADNE